MEDEEFGVEAAQMSTGQGMCGVRRYKGCEKSSYLLVSRLEMSISPLLLPQSNQRTDQLQPDISPTIFFYSMHSSWQTIRFTRCSPLQERTEYTELQDAAEWHHPAS